MLYLLNMRRIDGNTNFKNAFFGVESPLFYSAATCDDLRRCSCWKFSYSIV